ncbi:MAG: hypothetical protein GYA50_01505 [Eubacteriaceae bacterium]|nr:hypothetical protein [Eubacteriaceae bacterium]
MKKFISFLFYIKSFASMIFTGLILAYIAAGWLYSIVMHEQFNYTIPAIFVLQGIILALSITILWYLIFTDAVLKKLRYWIRLICFVLILSLVLTGLFLMFFTYHTDWARLWIIIAMLFVCVTAGISVIAEIYFRLTGKKYTQVLENYKKNISGF